MPTKCARSHSHLLATVAARGQDINMLSCQVQAHTHFNGRYHPETSPAHLFATVLPSATDTLTAEAEEGTDTR